MLSYTVIKKPSFHFSELYTYKLEPEYETLYNTALPVAGASSDRELVDETPCFKESSFWERK